MRYLSVVFALLASAGLAFAFDGDGAGILPFTSPNCSGQIEVHADGTVIVTGVVHGIPFVGVGTASQNEDGKTVIDCDVKVDGGKARKQPKGDLPVHVELGLDEGDYTDGNPSDDAVGTVDVEGGGLGSGSIQVYG